MSVHTPLTHVTTFLSTNRRVTAPPPTPRSTKSRTALISDTPPKCRRRLSFTDPPDITLPPSPPTKLLQLSSQLATPHQPSIWTQILHQLSNAPWTAHIFTNSLITDLTIPEYAFTALPVVPHVLANRSSPSLVAAVLDALIRHSDHPKLVEKIVNLILDDDWSRVYAPAIAQRASHLLTLCTTHLAAPYLDPDTWLMYLAILATVCEAVRRLRQTGQHLDFRLGRQHVALLLTSFERVAPLEPHATERALAYLKELFRDSETLSLFALENAAAVLSEIATAFASNHSLVSNVVQLLAVLASPNNLYYLT